MTELVDQYGRPLRRELLTRDIAGPTLAGVRSPIAGYPADGMTPVRLAELLREADQGEPLQYFELAEIIEERDLHYAGVLATRKRSVAQIDVTVESASDDPADVAEADLVREWLKRDELADEMFDILDAIGKGVSFTEIIWDTSDGNWWPARLEWRDPRWFRFDRLTQRRPLLRGGVDGTAQAEPLEPFKFIYTQIKAKSGLPIRSGIARLAAWAWMFKAFTQRDWAIFTQTYGQPVRVGKYHADASKEDKATLFRAVANIAGDCAAIIPQSMMLEFIESGNVTAGAELYERRADWLDRQVSKAVLGQTTTTDAIAGGHAVSQEHRQVQEDIETADCKSASAALNRDLIRPWFILRRGPSKRYPRLIIARPHREDLKQMTDSLAALVPLGLKVQASEVRDKLGLSEPETGSDVLGAPAPASAPTASAAPTPTAPGVPVPPVPALQSAEVKPSPAHPAEQIAAAMLTPAVAATEEMIGTIETMMAQAADLGELRLMLASAYGELDSAGLAAVLAGGLAAAQAAGRSDLADESAGT
ncbi:MAG: DUF935 domain-containing protein [Sphingomonadales bacterium]|nr:DUF935 domain-containing protein [Sphingomonadales bacterium]